MLNNQYILCSWKWKLHTDSRISWRSGRRPLVAGWVRGRWITVSPAFWLVLLKRWRPLHLRCDRGSYLIDVQFLDRVQKVLQFFVFIKFIRPNYRAREAQRREMKRGRTLLKRIGYDLVGCNKLMMVLPIESSLYRFKMPFSLSCQFGFPSVVYNRSFKWTSRKRMKLGSEMSLFNQTLLNWQGFKIDKDIGMVSRAERI